MTSADRWCPGDVFIGTGHLDQTGVPVTPGTYRQVTSDGAPVPTPLIDAVAAGVVPTPSASDYTTGCALDPVSGDLFTTGFRTNVISRFASGSPALSPTMPYVDASAATRLPTCSSANPNDCGAIESIVFDRSGNFYVGSVLGTNRILKYSNNGALSGSFAGPVGRQGIDWLDLAADQNTVYYTSEDNSIRVFRLDGSPIDDLIQKGVKPDPIDPAHFGYIPVALENYPAPGSNTAYGFRILPPGDGSGGFLAAIDQIGVVWVGFDGRAFRTYGDSVAGAKRYFSVDLAPDAKSFWTATMPTVNEPSKLYRFHIPTGQMLADSAADPAFDNVYGACVVREYTAAAVQPTDCATNPNQPFCSPPVNCRVTPDDPDCVPPLSPVIQPIPNQENYEGDIIGSAGYPAIQVAATSPLGHELTYTVTGLPEGLAFDPASHQITGTLSWHAADITPVATIRVTVIDAIDPSLVTRSTFWWTVLGKDAPPSITVSGGQTITTGHNAPIAPITITAIDPDYCDHVLMWLGGAPPAPSAALPVHGLTLTFSDPFPTGTADTCTPRPRSFTATISGTPDRPGAAIPFTIYVTDGVGSGNIPLTFTWTVTNTPPAFAAPLPAQASQAGATISLNVGTATDPDGDPVTYSAANLPPGLLMSSAGAVSGTPTTGGTYNVVITAKDPWGGEGTAAFTWVVNQPPVCGNAIATPATLWPPDGRFDRIRIGGVTDPDLDRVTLKITRILQDEPTTTVRDPGQRLAFALLNIDAVGVGAPEALLRAERAGDGDGRVYEIRFTAADGRGGTCDGAVFVGVPVTPGESPIDSRIRFDSMGTGLVPPQ